MSRAETDPTRRPTRPAGGPRPGPGLLVRTAAQARAAVTAVLARHGRADSPLRDDACLAVTELVTNAIRHAGGVTGFAVGMDPGGTVLTIDVEDASDVHPHSEADSLQDLTRLGGRGWALARRVSDDWEIHPTPDGGKRIRLTLGA
ncbi:ATP-binding protein [Streptomyces sp. TLI_171]|uniref:ATP-binding protein n=1 Tax=Streptomyces sp. TLI_171 TaxID=1938859 RepID=UPI000C66E368|nr:ATP-binding protein [Streptomyces sp. TLI_171]RKE17373.1 anti-sigma regulatory factor (Ser/Thr protein kinase) [Streptomyces sp. TLI_171]